MLQFGETVSLAVDVANEGEGVARETSVTLKNMSHGLVMLDQGRTKLGEIESGKRKQAAMSFSIKRPSRRRGFDGEPIDTSRAKLRVTIWDSVLGEPITEVIEIPVADARTVKRERRALKVPSGAQVRVFAGANAQAKLIGRASAGTLLRSDAVTDDGWRRVELKSGGFGFVRSGEIKVLSGNRKANSGALAMDSSYVPPAIDLDIDDLVTSSPTLRLTGSVGEDEGVRDVFVFVNDKKVYYKSFDDIEAGKNTARLDLPVDLKEGSNSVAIVARKSDELVSRRVFGVYRSASGAVAERRIERTTKTQ
ncbi:MAG: SH3 domain-containing protein [Myxococcota bacterium]